mgnify:CR=1 FL=1
MSENEISEVRWVDLGSHIYLRPDSTFLIVSLGMAIMLQVRTVMNELVLATDMKRHMEIVGAFSSQLLDNSTRVFLGSRLFALLVQLSTRVVMVLNTIEGTVSPPRELLSFLHPRFEYPIKSWWSSSLFASCYETCRHWSLAQACPGHYRVDLVSSRVISDTDQLTQSQLLYWILTFFTNQPYYHRILQPGWYGARVGYVGGILYSVFF